jgi:hypothetical protein
MERTAWPDERIDDAFTQLRDEMREMRQDMRETRQERRAESRALRGDLAQMKLFMLGGLITTLAAIIATNG